MPLSNEQLHTLTFSITPDVVESYPHMLNVWKALLGGYVLPEMAKQEPGSVAGNKNFEALMKEYTPEKIEALFSHDKLIEVIKEVPVITEKIVLVGSGEKVVHRRLKSKIEKISRKKRSLTSEERDLVIHVFNEKQAMLDKSSAVFHVLIETINSKREEEDKISAPQLAGYWSSLCRWADYPRVKRDHWIERSLKKGVFTLTPVYSEKFVATIQANYAAKKKEAEERKKDHAEIKRTGERRKIIVSESPRAEALPVAALDLTDIL